MHRQKIKNRPKSVLYPGALQYVRRKARRYQATFKPKQKIVTLAGNIAKQKESYVKSTAKSQNTISAALVKSEHFLPFDNHNEFGITEYIHKIGLRFPC